VLGPPLPPPGGVGNNLWGGAQLIAAGTRYELHGSRPSILLPLLLCFKEEREGGPAGFMSHSFRPTLCSSLRHLLAFLCTSLDVNRWGSGPVMHFTGPVPPVVFSYSSGLGDSGAAGSCLTASGPPSLPPLILSYWALVCPRSRGAVSADPPSASSLAGPYTLSSTGPLVVLFPRDNCLAEEDHRLPRPFASQHGAN